MFHIYDIQGVNRYPWLVNLSIANPSRAKWLSVTGGSKSGGGTDAVWWELAMDLALSSAIYQYVDV